MEMHQVRYFLALCETLNFSHAAETCNMLEGFKQFIRLDAPVWSGGHDTHYWRVSSSAFAVFRLDGSEPSVNRS
jgi:hypothetical protein